MLGVFCDLCDLQRFDAPSIRNVKISGAPRGTFYNLDQNSCRHQLGSDQTNHFAQNHPFHSSLHCAVFSYFRWCAFVFLN